MKILVLGSGVIGVSSAWYLQEAGYDVTVVDRQTAPGLETSFANGGQVSWGSGEPWAAPGIPLMALKWLFRTHSPLVLRPRLDPALWRWLLQMLRNCTHARFAMNHEHMTRLARYSHQCLAELRGRLGIEYDQRALGNLVLYRSQRSLEHGIGECDLLQRLDIPFRMLDRAQCVQQEPALAGVSAKITGGVYFPADESGDCYTFTQALAELAQQRGVRFLYSTTVERLSASNERVEAVVTGQGSLTADSYVLACGSYTPLLLRPLGMRVPVYPVKGYSLTAPVVDDAAVPRGSVTDEAHKVVATRLGNRIRAAGTAELAGYDMTLRPSRLATIEHVVRDLFPGGVDFSRAQAWCGLRPMTPDNPPVLGATPYRNLFLNTGHGTLGWTMACGSGKAIADLISGVKPAIRIDDYAWRR
ncbi:MAG TPA: D-amino acid dehydrogenase [Burkholderiales bacterium]|nr:D-amino acid dehydrogenase [Burkholderiales bacterium]